MTLSIHIGVQVRNMKILLVFWMIHEHILLGFFLNCCTTKREMHKASLLHYWWFIRQKIYLSQWLNCPVNFRHFCKYAPKKNLVRDLNWNLCTNEKSLGESFIAVKKYWKISQVVMVITSEILNLSRVAGGHEW